jgi:two-component system NtrC family sensor kinase
LRIELRKRIFLNFVLVIALFGVLGAILAAVLINRTILDEAQRSIRLNLRSAWNVIQSELDKMELFVTTISTGKRIASAFAEPDSGANRASLESVRRQCGFDFFSLTDMKGRVIMRTLEPYRTGDYLTNDPFVNMALKGKVASGLAILGPERLRIEGGNLEDRAFIAFEQTPKAKPRPKTSESAGMALIASAPVQDEKGNILGAIYAGVLLNRNHALVDRIRSIVFEDKTYNGRPLGTVTIFQWDVRIATNVTLPNGNRAIGTRVSEEVYDKVLENNMNWYDRAFVVNDWYLSAYDPIHDIEGRVIGILYVGVLAKKYEDIKRTLWKLYGGLSFVLAFFVVSLGFFFSRRLTGSLSRLSEATAKIERGDLSMRVPEPSADDEVRDLTLAFNSMAMSLADREEKLKAANLELERANESLQRLNENYLDMLGFVSHELKNTLGVIYTSARALDTGIVGPLNDRQAILVRNIANSIRTAVTMTRNYLDLARIEKGELRVDAKEIDILKDVVDPVLEELKESISEHGAYIENGIPSNLRITGDLHLLRIVYKNLIDNALKYGRKGGKIRLDCNKDEGNFRFNVWNEGKGLSQENISRLFGKFVRFDDEKKTSRSTGLGLFITREIIVRHGGNIWAESKEGEWIKFTFTIPI